MKTIGAEASYLRKPADYLSTFTYSRQLGKCIMNQAVTCFVCFPQIFVHCDTVFSSRYLLTKILSQKDQERTHVFSSFFYRRLTQKDNKRRGDDANAMT